MKTTIPKLIAAGLMITAMGMILILSWLTADSRVRSVYAEMQASLQHEAVDVARRINPELAKKLTFSLADKDTAAFGHIREQMTIAEKLLQQCSIYSMALRNQQIVIGPTNDPEGIPQTRSSVMVPEPVAVAAQQVLKDKRPLTAGPVTDENGIFFFALAPVLEPGSGEVLMIIAINVDANTWQPRVNATRYGPMLAMVTLTLIVLGAALAIRWHNRQRKQDTLRLKAWILIPTALTMLVGLLLFGTYLYQLDRKKSDQEMLRLTEQAKKEWNRNAEARVQLLKVQIDHLVRDPLLLKAWQNRDLPSLNALSQPIYQALKGEYKITHFYYIEPERTCFLRVHQPDRRGDLIDRSTLLAAVRTGEDTWGAELGPMGTFTLRYVRPWRQEGRLVGYLELGMEIEGLVEELAQSMKLDLVSLIRKEYSTKVKFEAGRQAFGFVSEWESNRDFVITHQTSPDLPVEVKGWIKRGHVPFVPGIKANSSQDERSSLCALVHLPDVSGHDVADLILMQDVTAQTNAESSALFLNLGLAVMMSGCILVLLWSVTGAAEQQLESAFAQVKKSEESYRRQFADNSEIMLLLDPKDGRILDANAQAVAYYGSSRKRLMSMLITDINSRAVSEVKLSMEAVVLGQNRHFEFQHRLADGSIRDVEITSSLIHFGESMILHTIIHDITAHKKVVEELTTKLRQLEARSASTQSGEGQG